MSEILTQVKVGQVWTIGNFAVPFYFVTLTKDNAQFFPKCQKIMEIENE